MARIESQMLAGYFKTPTELLQPIADLIIVGPGKTYSVVDPCAADGEAVIAVTQRLFPEAIRHQGPCVDLYACEMEETRYQALHKQAYRLGNVKVHAQHGDAMRMVWDTADIYGHKSGAGVLYANPPYDFDPKYKRLEEKFLVRFTPVLSDAGVLVFIVPYNALSASADTLARNYRDLRCYVFPESESYKFAKGQVFKQVVLVGVKRPTLPEPDPVVRAQVLAWSTGADLPILGSERGVVEMPGHDRSGFSKWQIKPLDVAGLCAHLRPWATTDRAGRHDDLPGILPDDTSGRYPLAVPPKPAHLAAAIASGVFNGAEVHPQEPGRPRLRVKGVFDKDFVKTEDKIDKDGKKTGQVEVEQPKLKITVLDVQAGEYHTLKSTPETTGAVRPADMTVGDLLTGYGRSLMQVMREQCPVLYDPATDTRAWAMPEFKRPLYNAQENASRALVELLGGYAAKPSQRRGKAAYLLGEIGVGKSATFVATASAIRAKRVLITAPPHLMQSWVDQVAHLLPSVPVSILDSVDDVDAFCSSASEQMMVGVMSRSAKLTHAWAGVTALTPHIRCCPKCGGRIPADADGIEMSAAELASKRRRHGLKRTPEGKWIADGSQFITPYGTTARIARDLALCLMLCAPQVPQVNQVLRSRARDQFMLSAHRKGDVYKQAQWGLARPKLRKLAGRVAREALRSERERAGKLCALLLGLLAAVNEQAVTAALIERLYTATMFDPGDVGNEVRDWCRAGLLLLNDPLPLGEKLKGLGLHATTSYGGGYQSSVWGSWAQRAEAVRAGKDDPESYRSGLTRSVLSGGAWRKHPFGSIDCATEVLAGLYEMGTWRSEAPCGEPLYQAIPEPRRVSLTAYLARKYPGVIDLLGCDEAHEIGGDGNSAQSISEHRLVSLGMPVVMLTGSVMNGYAKSLFTNQWGIDPQFRREFPRGSETAFSRRYGYIKQLVQQKDSQGKVVEWGSQSDRKQTTAKEIGYAPGVLPLFLLRYLLRIAVTLHKKDLALDLPKHREEVAYVGPEAEQEQRYKELLRVLKEQIRKDKFDPVKANMLFGMLSELPSYLDRCTDDTGNRADGSFAVAYPENEDLGSDSGRVLCSFPGLPAGMVMPKEQWMLRHVEQRLSAGRRVMIFGWHEAVLPRLQRLVEHEIGEPAALLQAGKVQAAKRQAWIDDKVISKKRRVLVVNGAAVQTGLNNLVWFQDAIWHQNPGVNPIVARQATGRIDRIGKSAETESTWAVYEGTAQALALKLLLHKVGVSMAADGLDAENALQAAGVGSTETIDAFSVGRALFEMMERGEAERMSGESERQRPSVDIRTDIGARAAITEIDVRRKAPAIAAELNAAANDLAPAPAPVPTAKKPKQLTLF